jgi:hypothetical protein
MAGPFLFQRIRIYGLVSRISREYCSVPANQKLSALDVKLVSLRAALLQRDLLHHALQSFRQPADLTVPQGGRDFTGSSRRTCLWM